METADQSGEELNINASFFRGANLMPCYKFVDGKAVD